MKTICTTLILLTTLFASVGSVSAQNWLLVIKDNVFDTPVSQVNGVTGGVATLYASVFNFTGTPASDDGSGSPAPAASLDYAGFGFTLNPGQTDLESLFSPDSRIPGWPRVAGSSDGITPGFSGYVALGTFDLKGLPPGTYEEDFTAGAFPTDPTSPIMFGDIHGTLTLNVLSPATVPEPNLWCMIGGIR